MTDAKLSTMPHSMLTPIEGRPSPDSLIVMSREVYANAMAVSTEVGAPYGHLGAIMPAARYAALGGAPPPYVIPANPGVQGPAAANATNAQLHHATNLHAAAKKAYMTHNDVNSKIKQQILAAVNKTYLSTLSHDTFGYAECTALEIITHLHDTYSEVDENVLEKNRAAIGLPWNPDDGIETMFDRIIMAQKFALNAGQAHVISDATATNLAFGAIDKTGVFLDDCKVWRGTTPAQRTMVFFRSHFTHGWKERNIRIKAKSLGYEALLITTEAPTEEVAMTAEVLAAMQSCAVIDNVKMYYCYSHGLGYNKDHISSTCTNKKEGHKDDATMKNPQGGSNRINGRGFARG